MNITQTLSYFGLALPAFDSDSARHTDPLDLLITGGLSVQAHLGWPRKSELLAEWDRLVADSPAGTAFHTPDWQGSLARPFSRAGRYRLITVRYGSRLVSALPLQINLDGSFETPGVVTGDYLDPLFPAEADKDLLFASWQATLRMLRRMTRDRRNGPELILHNVRPDAPWRAVLPIVCAAEGFIMDDQATGTTASVELAATWDDHLTTLPGHDRRELRRKLKQAQGQGRGRLEVADTEATVAPAVETVLGFIASRGGKRAAKSRLILRPVLRQAGPALVRAGRMTVNTLFLEDKPAAGVVCLWSQRGPMIWSVGFDPEAAKASPGMLVLAMTLQEAIKRGHKCVDQLRGQYRHKNALGGTDRSLHTITLRRRNV